MIRLLQSDLSEDFIQELRQLAISAAEHDLRNRVNPQLTFKFSGLNPEETAYLVNRFIAKEISFWQSSTSADGIIVSFGYRSQLSELADSARRNGFERFSRELALSLENLSRTKWNFRLAEKSFPVKSPMIMGVLNITPDSFSDGGKFLEADAAINQAVMLIETGADILDIGAESTRPGSVPVSVDEEWRRLKPVLQRIRSDSDILVSVDTYKAQIAMRALEAGADIINDISGLTFDPEMVKIAAKFRAPVVIMHIKGTPRDMQKNPQYQNLMEEIYLFLNDRIKFARENGVDQIIIDPGIGFGKRPGDNFEILRRIGEFRLLGCPILVGPSRKSFIGNLLNKPPSERQWGTAAAVVCGFLGGAHIFRVHDVAEIRQVLAVSASIHSAKYNISV